MVGSGSTTGPQERAWTLRASSPNAPVQVDSQLGKGELLDSAIRSRMEVRFGRDFSGVRVHSGPQARRAARSLDADAFARGGHVVFAEGRYAPQSPSGERLLAHELVHVIQQSGQVGPSPPQLKANATRFQDEPTLDEVSDGKRVLKKGDQGEAVIRVTTALSELGHYKTFVINEYYDGPVATAVSSYQTAKGLKGKVPDGTVEKQTFDKLDQDFSAGFKVERDVLATQKSAGILKETQWVDPTERKASERAISTETPVNPVTGLPPTFVPDIPGKGKYGDRLRAVVDAEILAEWNNMAKGKTAARTKAGALYGAATVDPIAVEAENAVKKVFGEYIAGRTPPQLKLGVNVHDAWKKKEADLRVGGKTAKDAAVDWRVQKILDGDKAVKKIDSDHGAIQSRAAEAAIVGPIKAALMVKYRAKLLELHKAWPGFEEGGEVFVQLFKGTSPDAQKEERWTFFQTFIHEYIHSLEHGDHVKYRESKAEPKGGFTLREGTTDYFTKIVWNSITIDDALRARIEGSGLNDPKVKFPIPPLNTYDEAENAERLAGVVGIRNVAAAFFLGKVDLVGKP